MSNQTEVPDVRQLADEELASADFPAAGTQNFRIHFASEIHDQIWQHASADTSVEICGALVGKWLKDSDGPYLDIQAAIQCDEAASKFAEVTFTHDSWAKINSEMDSKYTELNIVGWYHSHPDFGIFLSDRDTFIQQNFFSAPGQVAHVVDPIRKTEGVFYWKEGKPTSSEHYWIGNRIYTPTSSDSPTLSATAASPEVFDAEVNPPSVRTPSSQDFMVTLRYAIPYILIFCVGFLLSWAREFFLSNDRIHERVQAVEQNRFGLTLKLDQLTVSLHEISTRMKRVSEDHRKLAGDDNASQTEEWVELTKHLQFAESQITKIRESYAMSRDQEMMVAIYMEMARRQYLEEAQQRKAAQDEKTKEQNPKSKQTNKPTKSKADITPSKSEPNEKRTEKKPKTKKAGPPLPTDP